MAAQFGEILIPGNDMFLVEDQRGGTTYLVFTYEDPRKDEYTGPVTERVTLDYDMETVHSWSDGHARPEACVGRSKDDPKHYQVVSTSGPVFQISF